MKKRNLKKLIYLFALIINLTLFKLANQHSNAQEHPKIQVQPSDQLHGILDDSLIHFGHSSPGISNQSHHTSSFPLLKYILVDAEKKVETPIYQTNPEVLDLN